jgi:hypothetical protein
MKSRITVDLDWDNQPVIKIQYEDSEDVRDKMVKRMLQGFGGISTWLEIGWVKNNSLIEGADKSSEAIIRPIFCNEKNMHDLQDRVTERVNHCCPRGLEPLKD